MDCVLLVGEGALDRERERCLLVRSGYRVLEAGSIYEANDVLYENPVDAVLVDVATAGGRLFADVVGRFHPGTPVILVGNFPAGMAERCGTRHDRGAGAADLLGKLATAIGRRRGRRENNSKALTQRSP